MAYFTSLLSWFGCFFLQCSKTPVHTVVRQSELNLVVYHRCLNYSQFCSHILWDNDISFLSGVSRVFHHYVCDIKSFPWSFNTIKESARFHISVLIWSLWTEENLLSPVETLCPAHFGCFFFSSSSSVMPVLKWGVIDYHWQKINWWQF